MKKLILTLTLFMLAALAANAQLSKETKDKILSENGWGEPTISPVIGYQLWKANGGFMFGYNHVTHPADAGFMTGSPGPTKIKDIHAVKLGFEISKRYKALDPYIGLAAMFFVAEDNHQNYNDTRPPSQGSFVYSKVFEVGGQADIGLRLFPFKEFPLYLKGYANETLMAVDHGYDRWGTHSPVKTITRGLLGAGGAVGFNIAEKDDVFKSYFVEIGYNQGINNETKFYSIAFGVRF